MASLFPTAFCIKWPSLLEKAKRIEIKYGKAFESKTDLRLSFLGPKSGLGPPDADSVAVARLLAARRQCRLQRLRQLVILCGEEDQRKGIPGCVHPWVIKFTREPCFSRDSIFRYLPTWD